MRAHSLKASLISFSISGMSAMASLLSEVKGIRVDEMCVRKMAGPEGMPLPEGWSSPYRLQSMLCMACVETQSPCW